MHYGFKLSSVQRSGFTTVTCRFQGDRPLTEATLPSGRAPLKAQAEALPTPLPLPLDGALAQLLQRLSKRDPVTKVKALQVGRISFRCALQGLDAQCRSLE